MSDEFLYRLREPPRPEFVAALRERVFQAPSRLSKDRLFRISPAIGLTIAVTVCESPAKSPSFTNRMPDTGDG